MPAQQETDYQRVKAAILDRYEVTEETQRQRFRTLRDKTGNHPNTLVAKLKEYATRWLKPQTPGERAIVNKIVLEQVYQAIPTPRPIRGCLMRNRSTFIEQAAAYLENFFLAERVTCSDGLLPERAGLKKRS